ncbi:MAG TPA: hypothetical protein PLF84_19585 [Bryobacteraceae bacterium]|nr:hypothetical protein [Bryobacterales bacterium]HRJ21260.1 hypothetical protein [Bryobacteraceae bacterium]
MGNHFMTAAVLLMLAMFMGVCGLHVAFPVKVSRFYQRNEADHFGDSGQGQSPVVLRLLGVVGVCMAGYMLFFVVMDLLRGRGFRWSSGGQAAAGGEPGYGAFVGPGLILAMGLAMVLIPGKLIPKGWRAAAMELDEGGSWRVVQGVYRVFGMAMVLFGMGIGLKALGF